MGWFSSNSGNNGASNAGGTDWGKKKEKAGSNKGTRDFGKGDWGKPETSGGSGGTMSDKELKDNGF